MINLIYSIGNHILLVLASYLLVITFQTKSGQVGKPPVEPPKTKIKRQAYMSLIIDKTLPKTKVIQIRISEDEDNLLSMMSKTSGRTKSDIIRWLFVKLKPVVSDDIRYELVRLRRDLNSGVGNNLNQLAFQANRSGHVSPELSDALEDWKKLRQELTRVINEVQ